MDRRFVLILLAFMLVSIACLCSNSGQPTQIPVSPTVEPLIGTVSLERNQVAQSHQTELFIALTGTNPLYNGDGVQVTQGGEGLLDFGDNLKLRLFNASQLGGITAESAPNIPLNARMTLERGGFTGHLTQPGAQAVFITPGMANITVYGTQFFVIYDEAKDRTVAANYDGSMLVSSGGGTAALPAGSYVILESGSEPGPPQSPIPFSLAEFEDLSRDRRSPVAVIELLETAPTPTPTPPTLTPESSNTPTFTPTDRPTHTPTITSTPPPIVLVDLVELAPSASWVGNDGELPFPGEDTDKRGFALYRDNFQMEDGSTPRRVLETHPTWVSDGYINGWYYLSESGITLQPGDRIVARVGFLDGAKSGDITFKVILNYGTFQTGCGEFGCERSLEIYDQFDGRMQDGVFILPPETAGQELKAIRLVAEAGGSSAQDWGVWAAARLERPWGGIAGTPTPLETNRPGLKLAEVSPESIVIPGDCGSGTTKITVTAFDDTGIDRVNIGWSIEAEKGRLAMQRIDDQTYSAEIGPVQTAGDVLVTVVARDLAGNQSEPLIFYVTAYYCFQ